EPCRPLAPSAEGPAGRGAPRRPPDTGGTSPLMSAVGAARGWLTGDMCLPRVQGLSPCGLLSSARSGSAAWSSPSQGDGNLCANPMWSDLDFSYTAKELQFGGDHHLHSHLSLPHQIEHIRGSCCLQATAQRLHIRLTHLGIDVELAHTQR